MGGELYDQSSSFAFVPDFSMRTSLACVWEEEEARAPLIAPLEGAQHVSKGAALGHPRSPMASQHVRISTCRCAVWSSCTGKVVVLPRCLIFFHAHQPSVRVEGKE